MNAMNASEFFGFITPQNEPLQLGFFVLIVTMFFGTIISTWLNAKGASWEGNWNNGTPDDRSDDLDIDHGSVTDLWHAVATKSEKLAEVMPGLLLVVGLLGTFLGLGLALNHASNILGQSNALSATGAANSMADLMSMMQGLGTKFKTSTWGIAFFLLLKVWSSALSYEEKRLTWVIRKVKIELEHRKAQEQKAEVTKQQELFAQIHEAAEQIIKGFSQNFGKLSAHQKIQHEQILESLQEGTQGVRTDLAGISKALQSDSAAMKQVLEQSTQGVRTDLAGISKATQASSQAMVGFVSSTQTIIKDMSTASKKMADGANKVGIAGSSLVEAVKDFSTQFTQVLGDVRTDLSTAINDMSEQAAQTLGEGTEKLGEATREISAALGVLSQDVTTTMNGVKDSIEKSLKIQHDGAVLFRCSSDTLNENVTATTELVKKLGENISSGLQAVSESGRRMASIGKSLESIVPQMVDLVSALEPLKTLHNQHQPIVDETKALRTDLLKLDSRQELQIIRQIIEKSLEVQQGDSKFFKSATDALNTNVTTTNRLVNEFGDSIRSSLVVAETSAQLLTGIANALSTIVPKVQNLPPTLKPVEVLPKQPGTLVNETQGVREDLRLQAPHESQRGRTP